MRRVVALLVSILFLVAVLPAAAADRVQICHFSPGGSGFQTMSVSTQAAVRHIMEHGDHFGACFVGLVPVSKVFVTDYYYNEVFVVNADTNTQIDTLSTKKTPFRAVASPNGEWVFVLNFNGNNVSVVSTADDAVLGVVGVGSGPLNAVFSPDSSMAYVYNSRGTTIASVSVVRTSDLTVVDTITVGHGDSFASFNNIAISPDGAFVYVPNSQDNTVSVIETTGNQIWATVPVGHIPLSLAVTPDSQFVYVANSSSPVSVIRTSDHTVIANVGSGTMATQNLAITPDGQFVYTVGNTQFVQVISTATNSLVKQITMSLVDTATDIVIHPDSSHVYIPMAENTLGNGAVKVIEVASQSVVASVLIGGTPKYAAISPDGAMVYIANFNTLDVVQTSDNSLVTKINTGGNYASGVAVVAFP